MNLIPNIPNRCRSITGCLQVYRYFITIALINKTEICLSEAGTITFILISDHIVDQCSKIDLRSYQDHMAVK
jgi:hypothetical protein